MIESYDLCYIWHCITHSYLFILCSGTKRGGDFKSNYNRRKERSPDLCRQGKVLALRLAFSLLHLVLSFYCYREAFFNELFTSCLWNA